MLLDESVGQIQRLVREFGKTCKKRESRVNVGKSKIMVVGREWVEAHADVEMNDEVTEFGALSCVCVVVSV